MRDSLVPAQFEPQRSSLSLSLACHLAAGLAGAVDCRCSKPEALASSMNSLIKVPRHGPRSLLAQCRAALERDEILTGIAISQPSNTSSWSRSEARMRRSSL